jgi:hypothetical protein
MLTIQRLQRTEGSVMITAAICAGVLTILVAGYLTAIGGQYMIDSRTTQWQQALYIAEGGIEAGLNELNFHYSPGNNAFTSVNGWQTVTSGSVYRKSVTSYADFNGDLIGDYSVTVSNVAAMNPIVYATGTCYNSHGTNVTRMVYVMAKRAYPYAFLAKGRISSSNGQFFIDSFNSSATTNGLYPGDLLNPVNANATMGTTGGSISWSSQMYGNMTVSGSGTVSMANGSSMGNTLGPGRATTVPSAVAKGFLTNVPVPTTMPAPTAPFTGSPATQLGTGTGYNLGTTTNSLASGDYWATSLTGTSAGGQIRATGDVRIYVSGNVTMNQNCGLDVAPGGSLQLYVLGTITLNNAGYINRTSPATQCSIIGLGASGTSWSLTCNGYFNAAVYAPDVDVTVTGGGVITGAMYAKSFTLSGNGSFHYDEALWNNGVPYASAVWKEYRKVNGNWVVN